MVNAANIDELPNWQQRIPDNTKISTLSIPGTHNSAAYHDISLPSVQCQNASVTDQLNHGIRFLDVRSGKKPLSGTFAKLGLSKKCNNTNDDPTDDDELYVVHGKFPVKLPVSTKLADLLDEIISFLDSHNSELVILSIKQEGEGNWQQDEFAKLFYLKYVEPRKDNFYLGEQVPEIGSVRGRIILFRRFGFNDRPNEVGLNAESWSYNTVEDDRGWLNVQDYCELNNDQDIPVKCRYSKEQIERSKSNNDDGKCYISFCSASNFFHKSLWPEKIAKGLDQNGLKDSFGKRSGIVVLDFAAHNDWENSRLLVGLNFE